MQPGKWWKVTPMLPPEFLTKSRFNYVCTNSR
jgi:hypothetical protein